jgi:hypothetical protein
MLVSKRMGHSKRGITADLHIHLLRNTDQQVGETVAAAIPRAARRGHPVGSVAGWRGSWSKDAGGGPDYSGRTTSRKGGGSGI